MLLGLKLSIALVLLCFCGAPEGGNKPGYVAPALVTLLVVAAVTAGVVVVGSGKAVEDGVSIVMAAIPIGSIVAVVAVAAVVVLLVTLIAFALFARASSFATSNACLSNKILPVEDCSGFIPPLPSPPLLLSSPFTLELFASDFNAAIAAVLFPNNTPAGEFGAENGIDAPSTGDKLLTDGPLNDDDLDNDNDDLRKCLLLLDR